MLAGVGAVAAGNPYLVVTDSEWRALSYLREHASPDTVVLADMQFSTLVPGWGGGVQVVYGHPFETLDAASLEAAVDDFFGGEMERSEEEAFLERWSVELVLVRTDRHAVPQLRGYRQVWNCETVVILQRVPY
jgi:poly(3-hydroxybutyrate) depolymerase